MKMPLNILATNSIGADKTLQMHSLIFALLLAHLSRRLIGELIG